jgi:hypothetical protein
MKTGLQPAARSMGALATLAAYEGRLSCESCPSFRVQRKLYMPWGLGIVWWEFHTSAITRLRSRQNPLFQPAI